MSDKPEVVLYKSFVAGAPVGVHRDSRLRGFCLKVTPSGRRVFFVNTKVKGTRTNRTITIGSFPEILADDARDKAIDILRELHAGVDPVATAAAAANAARDAELQDVTLASAFEAYMTAKSAKLRPATVKTYKCLMRTTFTEWIDMPLRSISRSMVQKRFLEVSAQQPTKANISFRVLGIVFNFAAVTYENLDGKPLVESNPVTRISQLGLWNETSPREVVVYEHQYQKLFEVIANADEVTRDFMMFLLFTGLRKTVAASLPWSQVNMKRKTFKVFDKNGKWHELPMTAYLCEIFQRRHNTRVNDFVFPRPNGVGFITDPVGLTKRISQELGIHFTLHVTRKTFITAAARLLPYGIVKRLANHADSNDITLTHYTFIDTEQLREPLERIYAHFCKFGQSDLKVETVEAQTA